MKKACKYCGGIHSAKEKCSHKPQSLYVRDKQIKDFRNSREWKNKRREILEIDNSLCQACLNNLLGTVRRINNTNLSIHHIKSLKTAWKLRLLNKNLITLCSHHHELAESGKIKQEILLEITEKRGRKPPWGLKLQK